MKRNILLLPPNQTFTENLQDIFWSKVLIPEDENGCWIWVACKTMGYGVQNIGRKLFYSHRLSFMLSYGLIPSSVLVLHNCPGGDNRACVNPDHLWLGNLTDNHADMVEKGKNFKGEALSEMIRGENHPRAKLNSNQVTQIRSLSRSGMSSYLIASEFSISEWTIRGIVSGKSWKSTP